MWFDAGRGGGRSPRTSESVPITALVRVMVRVRVRVRVVTACTRENKPYLLFFGTDTCATNPHGQQQHQYTCLQTLKARPSKTAPSTTKASAVIAATTVAHTRHGASHRLAGTVTFPDPPPPISVIIQDVQCTREALAATVVIHPQLPVLFFFFLSFSFYYLKQKEDTSCNLQAALMHSIHPFGMCPCGSGTPTWVDFPNAQPAYKPGPYTWDGAKSYCAQLGGSLCSYATLCGGNKPFDGIAGTHPGSGDNWTPYMDIQYGWTNTGSSRACSQEGGSKSNWHGMSHCCEEGDDKICCNLPGADHAIDVCICAQLHTFAHERRDTHTALSFARRMPRACVSLSLSLSLCVCVCVFVCT